MSNGSISLSEAQKLAKEGIAGIERESRESLPTFEELKASAVKPKGHMCIRCSDYYAKFNAEKRAVDANWEDKNPICNGSLEELHLSLQDYAAVRGLSEEECGEDYALLELSSNPVKWGAAYLGIITSGIEFDREGEEVSADRWYQEEYLHCSSNFKVLRSGRRIGKCASSTQPVMTTSGEVLPAQLKNGNYEIYTLNQATQKIETTTDYTVEDNGVKPCTYLRTKTGRENEVTTNHPYWVVRKGKLSWINANRLKVGERIAVVKTYTGIPLGATNSPRRARMLGYLMGDGGLTTSTVTFTNGDDPIVSDLSNIVSDYQCAVKPIPSGKQDMHYKVCDHKGTRGVNGVRDVLKQTGLMGTLSKHKKVPSEVYAYDKETLVNFLGAYWDCDGWLCKQSKTYDKHHKNPRVEVGIVSASKTLTYQIRHLLMRLGIESSVRYKKCKYQGGVKDAWMLTILDKENIERFCHTIPLKAKDSNKKVVLDILAKYATYPSRTVDTIPVEIWPYILHQMVLKGITARQMVLTCNDRLRIKTPISRIKLLHYASVLGDAELHNLASSDITWDTLVEVKAIGKHPTYALSVPSTRTLIAGDIISHNTFVMRWDTLHFMITNREVKVLLICPYEKQVIAFLKDLDDLIAKSPILQAAVKHRSKSKHTVTFNNGSHLESVMTGGDKAGGGAKSRGQDADLIIFDEVDYVARGDIEAVIAVLADNTKCRIIASSTPTGKREYLYDICTDKKRRYKEFHHVSHVSPVYTKIADDEVRAASSTDAYRREILAHFGEEATGVFTQSDVDKALRKYTLSASRKSGPQSGWKYIVGVDWNGRKIGVHIVVTGYNPQSRKYRVVDKIIVANEVFTQTKACTTIIHCFEYWRAEFIYADFGYGEVSQELILKHATSNNKQKLAKNFKMIAMHGSTEIRNPVSGDMEKKNNQCLAVDLLVHHVEEGWVEIPGEEDYKGGDAEDQGLASQMRNFVVEKISAGGKPKYGGTDHTLTAFYLTIMAFQVEMSTFGVTKYTTEVIIQNTGSGGDGEYVKGKAEYQRQEAREGRGLRSVISRSLNSSGQSQSYGGVSTTPYDKDTMSKEQVSQGITGQVAMRRNNRNYMPTLFSRKSF